MLLFAILVSLLTRQPLACIVCEQGPDSKLQQEWLQQKHKTTQVTGPQGKLLGGVRVSLQDGAEPLHAPPTDTTSTYTRGPGLFSYFADVQSTQLLIFSKAGYASVAHRVAETLPQRIVLPIESLLTGTVVTASGEPVSRATVGPFEIPDPNVDHSDNAPPPVFPYILSETDEQGRFEARALKDTNYQFAVRSAGMCSLLVKARPAEPVRVVMSDDTTTVTGRLLGSRDRLAVGNAVIEARADELKEYTRTDREGNFSFGSLSPRQWVFRAVAGEGDLPHPSITADLARKPIPQMPLALVFNHGISIAGTVTDADTSQPIEGLQLAIEHPVPARAESDADGRFRFEKVDALTEVALRYDTSRFAYVDSSGPVDQIRMQTHPAAPITSLTIPLHRRAQITGVVISTEGAAAASASVFLRRHSDEETTQGGPSIHKAEADADGRFDFNVFPAGQFELYASDAEAVSLPRTIDVYTTSTATATLRLLSGHSVRGAVFDAAGTPVAGANVAAQEAGGDSGWSSSARTDAHGNFTLRGVPPRTVKLSATHSDFGSTANAEITAAQSPGEKLSLVFPKGNSLIAKVIGDDGNAVADAKLRYEYTINGTLLKFESSTTSEGLAHVDSIPVAVLEKFAVSNTSHVTHEAQQLSLYGTTCTVRLVRRGGMSVALKNGDDKTSAGEATAFLLQRSSLGEFLYAQQTSMQDALAHFPNLLPGFYKAAVRTADGYTESDAFELRTGEQKRLELSPIANVHLEGTVRDQKTHEPITGAIVSIEPKQKNLAPTGSKQAATAADGKFAFDALSAGEFLVTVSHSTYPNYLRAVHLRQYNPEPLDVILSAHLVTVHGTATYAGRPVGNTLIVLTSKQNQESPIQSALSRADGSYELAGVPPGEYYLNAEAPVSEDDRVGHRSYSLSLNEQDENHRLDLSFMQPVRVKGRIQVVNSTTPIPADATDHIHFMPKSEGGVAQNTSAKGGVFEVNLEPGLYRASLNDSAPQTVTIPDTSTRPVDITLTR